MASPGVTGVKVTGDVSTDCPGQTEVELRTPDSGYSSVSSHSNSRYTSI